MKKKLVLIVTMFILLLAVVFSGCNKNGTLSDAAYAETAQLEVAVLTDTHYFSPALFESSEVESFKQKCVDTKSFAVSSAIIKSAFDQIVENGVKYVFISGDLCDNHTLVNHTEFAAILKSVEDRGVSVYVAPGNHDVSSDEGYEGLRYTASGTERVADFYNPVVNEERAEGVTIASQFKDIYNDFGYSEAIAQNGLSYAAEVGDSHRLIVVDNCSSDLTLSGVEWAEQQVQAAVSANKTPILMMHKPIDNIFGISLLPATTASASALKNRLSAAGLKIAITGHNHANNAVTVQSTDETSTMYDIMTNSLQQAGNNYRMLRFSENYVVSEIKSVESVKADYIPQNVSNDIKAEVLADLHAYSENYLKDFVEGMIENNSALIKNTLGEFYYGKGVEVPTAFSDYLQSAVLDFLSMPFYRADGGDQSIEALYEKYGAELPADGGFYNIVDMVSAAMLQVFYGGENLDANRKLIAMADAAIKGLIVNVIDKGFFDFSDRFVTVSAQVMQKTCADLLTKGEFELLDSRIMHNLLQLPGVDDIKAEIDVVANIFPENVTTEEDFTQMVNVFEIACGFVGLDVEPYFESRLAEDGETKIYNGIFHSDSCLVEELFGKTLVNLVDDSDLPDRGFVLELKSDNYMKIAG